MSRAIGTPCETAVVNVLIDEGWPLAERRPLHGSKDLGDVTGTPGLVWEVKGGKAAENASDGQVVKWMEETEAERRNAKADYGILVMKRKGIGYTNARMWWAIMGVADWAHLVGDSLAYEDFRIINPLPVRLHLIDAISVLRRAGYGDPL